MQIRISEYETPAVLRAIIDLLTNLAALNDEADPMTARRQAAVLRGAMADAGVWQMGDNPTITDDELRDAPTLVLPRVSPAEIFGRSETLPEGFKPGVLRETVVVPSPPTVTTVTPPADVDSAGQPWDANIHSSSRDKVKDGTWRKRRNGPKSSGPAAGQSAPPVPPPPTAAEINALAATIPVPPPPPSGATFRSLVTKAAAAQAAGKVTPERIKELCATVGAADLAALSAMPAMVPVVDRLLDSVIG